MSRLVARKVFLHAHVWERLEREAGPRQVSPLVRTLVERGLRHNSGSWRFKEVVLVGSGGRDVNQLLEWLLGRQPLVVDLMGGGSGDALAPKVKVAMLGVLSKTQARRAEKSMLGMQLEEIGREEDCSKQAVWACLQRAFAKLERDDAFLAALVHHVSDLPEDPDEAQEHVRFWIERLRNMRNDA